MYCNPSWVWRGVGLGRQTPRLSLLEVSWARFNETLIKDWKLIENPSEILTKVALLLLYPAAQALWLGSYVVMFSTCGLQTAHVVLWRRAFTDARYNMWHVLRLTPARGALVVVSCCARSIVVQLSYWLGEVAGYEYWHVLGGWEDWPLWEVPNQ